MNEIRIVCAPAEGPLLHFVEIEDAQGRGFCAGTWRTRPDGMREMVLDLPALSDLVLAEPPADVGAEERALG
jgi:hypothetical protein